jgi:peptidyl-prolyl cis-trans isomerase C
MKYIGWFIVLLIALSACSLVDGKGEVVARVDDKTLTMDELKANFSEEEWKTLTNEQKKEYVSQWVNLMLLAKEAEKNGLDKDKKVKNRIEYAQQKILGNALISSRLAAINFSEEDMFNYYRIHQGEFSQPLKNFKVQRIYLIDSGMVNKVKQELQNGMRFEDAARVYSLEEIGKTGGFMGTVTSSDADSSFWLAVKNLKLYDVTTLQKENGFYLLRPYMEEEGVGNTGFESQKDEIRRRMLEERRKEVYDDLLKELKSKANVYLMI